MMMIYCSSVLYCVVHEKSTQVTHHEKRSRPFCTYIRCTLGGAHRMTHIRSSSCLTTVAILLFHFTSFPASDLLTCINSLLPAFFLLHTTTTARLLSLSDCNPGCCSSSKTPKRKHEPGKYVTRTAVSTISFWRESEGVVAGRR